MGVVGIVGIYVVILFGYCICMSLANKAKFWWAVGENIKEELSSDEGIKQEIESALDSSRWSLQDVLWEVIDGLSFWDVADLLAKNYMKPDWAFMKYSEMKKDHGWVMLLQKWLALLWYDLWEDGIDARYGFENSKTRLAIQKFQRENQLDDDGWAGDKTIQVMYEKLATIRVHNYVFIDSTKKEVSGIDEELQEEKIKQKDMSEKRQIWPIVMDMQNKIKNLKQKELTDWSKENISFSTNGELIILELKWKKDRYITFHYPARENISSDVDLLNGSQKEYIVWLMLWTVMVSEDKGIKDVSKGFSEKVESDDHILDYQENGAVIDVLKESYITLIISKIGLKVDSLKQKHLTDWTSIDNISFVANGELIEMKLKWSKERTVSFHFPKIKNLPMYVDALNWSKKERVYESIISWL